MNLNYLYLSPQAKVPRLDLNFINAFFSQEGAKVTISDLENSKGEETSKRFAKHYGKDRVHWCPCDVTKEDEFTNLFDSTEKFFGGTVDILVNNAGINHLPGWRKCMDVDIVSFFQIIILSLYFSEGKTNQGLVQRNLMTHNFPQQRITNCPSFV